MVIGVVVAVVVAMVLVVAVLVVVADRFGPGERWMVSWYYDGNHNCQDCQCGG